MGFIQRRHSPITSTIVGPLGILMSGKAGTVKLSVAEDEPSFSVIDKEGVLIYGGSSSE
jgi:hypothetical protein